MHQQSTWYFIIINSSDWTSRCIEISWRRKGTDDIGKLHLLVYFGIAYRFYYIYNHDHKEVGAVLRCRNQYIGALYNQYTWHDMSIITDTALIMESRASFARQCEGIRLATLAKVWDRLQAVVRHVRVVRNATDAIWPTGDAARTLPLHQANLFCTLWLGRNTNNLWYRTYGTKIRFGWCAIE